MINKRGEEIEEQLDRTIISSLHLQLEHCIKLAIYVRIGVRWIKRGPSNDRRCTPEIRVRLVNTSLRYRLRGEEGWYGSRQLIRYVCKFVDTWAHSYWAVKYDSPINNDNLGRPIMPKLPWPRSSEGGTMIGPRAWPAETKFNVGPVNRPIRLFPFRFAKFIAPSTRISTERERNFENPFRL